MRRRVVVEGARRSWREILSVWGDERERERERQKTKGLHTTNQNKVCCLVTRHSCFKAPVTEGTELTFFNTLLHSTDRAQFVSRAMEALSTSVRGLAIRADKQLRWLVRLWEAWFIIRYRRLSAPLLLAARAA